MRKVLVVLATLGLIAGLNTVSAQAKVKLTLWGLSDQKSFIDPILADFQKANPDISAEFNSYATDSLKESLKVAAAANSLPDLWFTWGGTLGSYYVENGMTLDLTGIAQANGWASKYNKAALNLSTYNGKVSGVPYHLNSMAVFYPKALFAKLNIKEPKTFAEFEASLKVLKANKVTPLAFAGKNGWHLMRLTEVVLEHYAGPKGHDDLNALKGSWNSPAVVKTFAKMKEWADLGYFPKGFVSLDPQEVEPAFEAGTQGYIIEGPWYDGSMASGGFDPASMNVFQFPTDQVPVRMSSFVEMFQVSAQTTGAQRAAAVKLAEFLTSKETVAKYIDAYGSSALADAPVSPKAPHVLEMANLVAKGNFLIGDQALPQEIVQKLFEATDKVMLKVWTPDQGAAALQKAVDAYKKK